MRPIVPDSDADTLVYELQPREPVIREVRPQPSESDDRLALLERHVRLLRDMCDDQLARITHLEKRCECLEGATSTLL